MKLISFIFLIGLSQQSIASDINSILYIGDSHSYGKLGLVVEKNLKTISPNVVMESSCGSTPRTWLGKAGFEKTVCGFWKKDRDQEIRSTNHITPNLADELNNYHPDVVIVQLGTNIAAGPRPIYFKESIVKIMNLIKDQGSECIWIGPPDAESKIVTKEKLTITNNLLRDLSKEYQCSYIDSLKLTKFPKSSKEGIHYPPTLSAKWGEGVSVELLKLLK